MNEDRRGGVIRVPGAFHRLFYKEGTPATTNAVEDYSGLAIQRYLYLPPQDSVVHVVRIVGLIGDSAVSDWSHYGDVAGLGVGIKLAKVWGGTTPKERVIYSGVKTNGMWLSLAGTKFALYPGAAPTALLLDLEFPGPGIQLDGGRRGGGEFLAVTLNDDFTGLNMHTFTAHGFSTPPTIDQNW